LLNRFAFNESKALEEDETKVNSKTLEPSFNFESAVLDGADFSKAKLIIPSTKQEITVEEALKRIHQSEQKFENRLNQHVDLVTPMNRGIAKQNAKKLFDQKENRRSELKQILEGLFGEVSQINKDTKFTSNKTLNDAFIAPIKKRIRRNDKQGKSTPNPFATFPE
jgi:hypothetical protein